MSSYKHFIEDFTNRSRELFNELIVKKGIKYDVTLLLTFATHELDTNGDFASAIPRIKALLAVLLG